MDTSREAALLAESNNRAILVFTVITIIFLPLSFFTSYYGMNLKDIANTQHTQSYFWVVCGTSTAIIIGLTLLFGFQSRIHNAIWINRQWSRSPDSLKSHDVTDGDVEWSPESGALAT